MKHTQRRFRTHAVGLVSAACAALAVMSPAGPAHGLACSGDCNSDGAVAVNELVMMVNMALGTGDTSACHSADANSDGTVSINELVAAVGAALGQCEASPELLGAVALSRHYVEVTFDGWVGPAAAQPSRYSITAPDGSSLAVTGARIADDNPSRVVLSTDAQEPVVYRVSVQTPGSAVGTASVLGSTNPEPQLQTAIALTNTQVLLTFDQAVAGGATNIPFYRIVVPGGDPTEDVGELRILGATLSADGFNVTLTTSPQKDYRYQVIVTNVIGKNGNKIIDPTANTTTFFGIGPVDTVRPQLLSAASPDRTTIILSFSEPMSLDTPDPTNFVISPPLVITDAHLSLFNTQIVLTTAPQTAGIDYTVTVAPGAKDPAGNLIDGAARSATFRYVTQPALQTAVSLGNTKVLLTFSERLDQASAETTAFYHIAGPDLAVTAAVLQPDQVTVLLTTASQANTQYTVTVTNVRGRLGGPFIDPTHNTASFTGIAPVDTARPRLLSAVAINSTTIVLTFSEPLLSLTDPPDNAAEDASNYQLSPAVTVVAAQLNASKTQVVLTTLPMAQGVGYTLTVNNLKDLAGNLIDPAAHATNFTFQGQSVTDDDLPRVVGASSTSNLTVVVQYSKPMSDSVLDLSRYYIELQPQLEVEVGADVGVLTLVGRCIAGLNVGQLCASPGFDVRVCEGGDHDGQVCQANLDCFPGSCVQACSGADCQGARFLDANHTQVEIQTLSQNDGKYVLTSTGAVDLAGNPLAPKQVIAGVVVDPTSAVFAGTGPFTNGMIPGNAGVDSDGDGMPDTDEQSGWDVTVTLLNGQLATQHQTANPLFPDTDGDGLVDPLEFALGTNPRSNDTDGEGLTDYDEYNIVYSDPTKQDTDGDGISDNLEVEFFKTNAIVVDSDGDGYSDDQELFEMNRDPRIADLPRHEIAVGSVRLQIDERYTFVDDAGNTQTETSSTATSLENDTSSSSTNFNQTVGSIFAQVEAGLDSCGTDNACASDNFYSVGLFARLKALLTVGGGAEFTTSTTTESATAAMSAFQSSLDKGRELSTDHSVTREVFGASLSADVTLENLSDIAFALSNIEIHVATTDPEDPTRLVPVATLLPDSTQQTGNAAAYNIGPGQKRGPIIFSNRDVYPNLIEDLMRSPRGLVFTVANYDQTTDDGRNFAFGLQQVRERTAEVSIDFGDGEAQHFHAITTGVLNRPRSELRCAPTGDHPDFSCRDDDDCGTSTPCEGGTIIGGFSNYGGTGRPEGTPLDFVLRDILQMRKSTPAAILAGPNLTANTVAQGDDVQVVPVGTTVDAADTVVVAPGRNLVLDTAPSGDDFSSAAPRIVAGEDGTADTAAGGDDIQVVPVGTFPLAAGSDVVAPGPNGRLDTAPANDDIVLGPDGILPGPDGAVQSVVQGDDVQLVPVATTGVPEDTVVITAGRNGVLDTPLRGDDVAAVVTGYEVAKSCDANTPFAILAGRNGLADTEAETGICTIASPPHFAGESCSRTVANPDAGCGVSDTAPTSAVAAATASSLTLSDATPFPSSGVITVGAQEVRYSGKAGNVLTITGSTPLTLPVPAGTPVTLVTGRCTADTQVVSFGQSAGSPNAIVVGPSTAQFLASVPGGDDIYVAPGIPCTAAADCSAGASSGQCTGPQNVVRVDQRRNGQFRRFWTLLLPNDAQFQTDFGDIMVRPGDAISLAFIQDVDRDGLIAQEEFLHGSSDFKKDTDDEGLGDFSEVRLGWDVGVVGQLVRHVFPDPTLRDSDGDGLTDKEEQDLRDVQCACDAMGPKSLLGSGRLLREPTLVAPFLETGAQPCRSDSDCGGGSGSCVDAIHCTAIGGCPPCSTDVTQNRTDPRVRDTDADGVADANEALGYLTGAGIVDTGSTQVILAGANLRADTVACPRNYCVEDANKAAAQRRHCMTDGDCLSHNCIHPAPCDEVQVVPVGNGVRDARTVVVAPGPIFGLDTSSSRLGVDDVFGSGNAVAESRLQGDDQLVVGPGQDVLDASMQCVDGGNFALCSAVKPGPNGRVDSLRVGDDVIIPGGTGQKLEVSDPLNPDTDLDLIFDGNERLLGSSPNLPGDAIFGGDLDADGLTDVLEGLGWDVQVFNAAGAMLPLRHVMSDPNLPDTDLDGIPDFAEANMPCANAFSCPTDPNTADTDGDGISDYDELSAEQFSELARYNVFFPGYLIDGTGSKQYGTDPTRVDSDGDGLSDRFELLVGWTVVRDDGSVKRVFSDPTRADSDGDGLLDDQELAKLSDPGDPDTDGDGRLDGLEVAIGTQPLQPDIFVSVTYSLLQLSAHPPGGVFGDGSEGLNEWRWRLAVQESSQPFPGTILSTERIDCPTDSTWPCGAPYSCLTPPDVNGAGCDTNRFNFFLNRSIAVALNPNNGIVLNGLIVEVNGYKDTDKAPIDAVTLDRCRMSFVDQPLTFDAAQSGTFVTRTFQLTGVDGQNPEWCRGLVVAEISVNCVGQGKGFCHAGNPCVTNADCESDVCTPNPGSNVGTCQLVCGDGVVEMGEACDDGNTLGGDGCSPACQIEPGSVCSGMPSECGTPTPTWTPSPTPTNTALPTATRTPVPPTATPTP